MQSATKIFNPRRVYIQKKIYIRRVLLSPFAPRKIRGCAPQSLSCLPVFFFSRERKKEAKESRKVPAAEERKIRKECSLGVEMGKITDSAAHLKDSRVKVTVHAEIPVRANEIRSTVNWSFAKTPARSSRRSSLRWARLKSDKSREYVGRSVEHESTTFNTLLSLVKRLLVNGE